MKRSIIAVAVSSMLVTAPAFAQFYVGAGVGESNVSSSTTGKLIGGFKFSPQWAVEGAYTDLGKLSGSDIQSWSLAAVGHLPVSGAWSLQGKIGATSNRYSNAGFSNHSDFLLGVGVNYRISGQVSVGLEYEDFGKFSRSNNNGVDNWSLNLKYAF